MSVDVLVAKTGPGRDELVTLADIGALNSLGYDRRAAMWQVERAIRPTGELIQEEITRRMARTRCLLPPMTETERLIADYRAPA